MKTLRIKFHLDLEVVIPDAYDQDWLADQYLSSDRLSIDPRPGEIGVVVCASSGVTEIQRI